MLRNNTNRKKRPLKIERLLLKEIESKCPFCFDTDIERFQVHHIDSNRTNDYFENLILICRNCHSKLDDKIITPEEAKLKKEELKKSVINSKSKSELIFKQESVGNNNLLIGSLNKMELYQNSTKIIRNVVQPDATCIDDKKAYEIKEKIDQLVEIDILSGKYKEFDKGKRYAFHWNTFKRYFKITDYHLIKNSDYEKVMIWLRKMVAINKPKLRKNNPVEWRNRNYSSIYSKIKSFGIAKEELYSIAYDKLKLKNPITSLKDLNDNNLKKLYQLIIRL
jgi:hypothetical protein